MRLGTILCLLMSVVFGQDRKVATIPEGCTLFPSAEEDDRGEEMHGLIEDTDPDRRAVPSRVVFAPNGTTVAYVAYRDGAAVPVIGERVGNPFTFLFGPVAAADAPAFAFRACKRIDPTRERWRVVTDRGDLPEEDWISDVAISADGKHVAYWTQPGARIQDGTYTRSKTILAVASYRDSAWSVKRSPLISDVGVQPPVFSPNGKRLAAALVAKSPLILLWDEKEGFSRTRHHTGRGATAKFPAYHDVAFGPKSKIVAFVASDAPPGVRTIGRPSSAVFWGKRQPFHAASRISTPVVLPSGKQVAYRWQVGPVRDGDKRVHMGVALDGKRADINAAFVSPPSFNRSGTRFVVLSNRGGTHAVPLDAMLPHAARRIDGGRWYVQIFDSKTLRETWRSSSFLFARDPIIDRAGKRAAWCAQTTEGWRIVTRKGASCES